MFGRKKMYKKGLSDAMQAYEGFAAKQQAALEELRSEVKAGRKSLEEALTNLGNDINGIYDYLTSQEKAALYHLSTPMDIKELEDAEKRLLLAVLYQLADDEGDDVTEAQRAYIRSVQKYLEIRNPQPFAELSVVGDIDSLDIQKAFLQVCLEFFYLQDKSELTDAQEDFLGNFSVNRKQAELIENNVSRLYNAVGPEGVAEKYGYVPQEEELISPSDGEVSNESMGTDWYDIQDSTIHQMFKTYEGGDASKPSMVETEHYLFALKHDKATCICKKTNQVSTAVLPVENYPAVIIKYMGAPDTILLCCREITKLVSLPDFKIENLSLPGVVLCCKNHYIVCGEPALLYNSKTGIWLYDTETCDTKKIALPFGAFRYECMPVMSEKELFLLAQISRFGGQDEELVLNVVDYKNGGTSVAQMKFKQRDIGNCFGNSNIPQILYHKDQIIVPVYRYVTGANTTAFCLIDPHEKTIVKILEPYPKVPFGIIEAQRFVFFKEKLFILDGVVGIYVVDLETAQTTILADKGAYLLYTIGNYLYFEDGSISFGDVYRINMDNPGMVENIP